MDTDTASQSSRASSTSSRKKTPSNKGGKKKVNNQDVPTKAVIRHLPPTMTAEEFLEAVSPLPESDYFYFRKADISLGSFAFSRAYIHFLSFEDIILFRDRFDGYVFVDSKGNEYPASVEFAPYQKIPKKERKDLIANTIEKDAEYIQFKEQLESGVKTESLPSTEVLLEELEARDRELKTNHGCPKVITPLIEYVVGKMQGKAQGREDRREEQSNRRGNFNRRKPRDKDNKLSKGDGLKDEGAEAKRDKKPSDPESKKVDPKKSRNEKRDKRKDRIKGIANGENEKLSSSNKNLQSGQPVKVLQKEKLAQVTSTESTKTSSPSVNNENTTETQNVPAPEKAPETKEKVLNNKAMGETSRNERPPRDNRKKDFRQREERKNRDFKSRGYNQDRQHKLEYETKESSKKRDNKSDDSKKEDKLSKPQNEERKDHVSQTSAQSKNQTKDEVAKEKTEDRKTLAKDNTDQKPRSNSGRKVDRDRGGQQVRNKDRPALEIYRPGARRGNKDNPSEKTSNHQESSKATEEPPSVDKPFTSSPSTSHNRNTNNHRKDGPRPRTSFPARVFTSSSRSTPR